VNTRRFCNQTVPGPLDCRFVRVQAQFLGPKCLAIRLHCCKLNGPHREPKAPVFPSMATATLQINTTLTSYSSPPPFVTSQPIPAWKGRRPITTFSHEKTYRVWVGDMESNFFRCFCSCWSTTSTRRSTSPVTIYRRSEHVSQPSITTNISSMTDIHRNSNRRTRADTLGSVSQVDSQNTTTTSSTTGIPPNSGNITFANAIIFQHHRRFIPSHI
jgi:hypothetical protein